MCHPFPVIQRVHENNISWHFAKVKTCFFQKKTLFFTLTADTTWSLFNPGWVERQKQIISLLLLLVKKKLLGDENKIQTQNFFDRLFNNWMQLIIN